MKSAVMVAIVRTASNLLSISAKIGCNEFTHVSLSDIRNQRGRQRSYQSTAVYQGHSKRVSRARPPKLLLITLDQPTPAYSGMKAQRNLQQKEARPQISTPMTVITVDDKTGPTWGKAHGRYSVRFFGETILRRIIRINRYIPMPWPE